MVAERAVSFRPNIVIGLGGMGTSFVARVKRLVTAELDRQIEMGLISVEQKSQALAQRFHFIGIDSWTDGSLPGVTPYQELDAFYALTPRGNINQVLPALFKDSGFAAWFPRDYQVRSYAQGCGHVHLRGRLAYMLQKEQNSQLDVGLIVRNLIKNAIALVPGVQGNESPIVTVWVCSSLAGGTGGGMFLTILQNIANAYLGSIKLYGAIIDSSIASWEQNNELLLKAELANHLCGLVELDAWMNPRSDLSDSVGWRSFWPSDNPTKEIVGVRPVADMVWLFGSQRFNGNGFKGQQDAIAASADTIATWVHSSTTQAIEAMDADIDNWIADFGASAVAQLGRPASYGSIGVAHLEYPAERVLEFLSASLAIDAIDSHLLSGGQVNRIDITDAVNEFLVHNSLREDGHDDLVNQYQALTAGTNLPARPPLTNDLMRSSTRTTIEAAMNFLNSERGRITALSKACAALSATLLNGKAGETMGIRGALVREVKRILVASPDGVNSAATFLGTLKSRIADKEADSIKVELNGDGGLRRGFEGDLQTKRGSLNQEVKTLSGNFYIPGSRERAVKEFVQTWWQPYVGTCEKVEVWRAVLSLLETVEDEVDLLLDVIETIREQLGEARKELLSRQTLALKRPSGGDQGGSVTYVLDDDQSLQRAFPTDEADALEVSTSFLSGEATGLLGRFEEMLDARRDTSKGALDRSNGLKFELKASLTEGLISRAREINHDRVYSLSVWEALELATAPGLGVPLEQMLSKMKSVFSEIVRAASPMFPADLSRLVGRAPSQPQSSIVLVFNDEAAQSFSASRKIPPGWEQSLIGNLPVRPIDSPDPHRVSLLHRLIGFPLLVVPENEIQVAKRARAELPDPELAWSDIRARRLPLDPPFSEVTRAMLMENTVSSFGEDEITYAGALAIGWQLYPYGKKTDGTPNLAAIMSPSKTVFANGLKDFVNRLTTNDSYLEALIGEVDSRLQQFAPIDWPRQVELARSALQDEWDNTEKPSGVTKVGEAQWSGRGSERYKALDMLLASVRDRLDLVNQNFVRSNTATHWVLESLRPKSPTG